jgi:hypothetical protein
LFRSGGGSHHEVKGLIERDAIDLYTRRHALALSVLDDYAVNLATFQLAAGHFGLVFL